MNKYKMFWARMVFYHHTMEKVLVLGGTFLLCLGLILPFFSLRSFSLAILGGYLLVSIIFADKWRENLPEHKFKEKIRMAEAVAAKSPPEVSAKIHSLIAEAKRSEGTDKLTSWIENYQKLVALEADYERIWKEFTFADPGVLFSRIAVLKQDLGLSAER